VGHSKIPGKHPGWPSWEDAAVAPEDIGRYLRDFERLVSDHGLRVAAYFCHVGHGCIHTRLNWDFSTHEGIRRYRAFMEDAADVGWEALRSRPRAFFFRDLARDLSYLRLVRRERPRGARPLPCL